MAQTVIVERIARSRTDWWTWTDHPNTRENEEQLALDPASGKLTRPLLNDMLALATQRRAGQHPQYEEGTWGSIVGMLPDLKTFELILETFLEKKRQLDVVVDCVRTWKFPLKDTQYELVCDGKVEELSWSTADANDGWVTESEHESDDLDVDMVDETSDRRSSNSEAQSGADLSKAVENFDTAQSDASTTRKRSSAEMLGINNGPDIIEGIGSKQVAPQASSSSAPINTSFSPLEKPLVDPNTDNLEDRALSLQSSTPDAVVGPAAYYSNTLDYNSPSTPDQHALNSPLYDPGSPPLGPDFSVYGSTSSSLISSPVSPHDSYGPPYTEPWYETATEFEVRIVRFRRRRMN